MSNYSDLADGLVTGLKNGTTNRHAYNPPVDSFNGSPAAVGLPEAVDPEIAFGGNSMIVNFRVLVFLSSADSAEGFRQLYDYIDPTTANKSVIKAVRDAPTLDGKADSAGVTRIENIGRRQVGGGFYFGFDALVEVIKTVA